MKFDSDDTQFVRGFEAGRVYASLGAELEVRRDEAFMVHVENAEMMLRIAERYGLYVRSEGLEDGWLEVEFSSDPFPVSV